MSKFTHHLTRRNCLKAVGLSPLTFGSVSAQPKSADTLAPLNGMPRMVHEFFVAQVRAAEKQGNAARAKLKTRDDAEAYVRDVRDRVAQCFGPFPEKTPLNPRITGTVERDAYIIVKVIFESRPGFLVTANLYVPKGEGKKPGVVGSCGHSANGKAADTYQAFAQGLARQGYVVLIFDPIGQGERLQYVGLGRELRPTGEHLLAGNQQFLVGEFLGSWRAWDGIRALDYLLTRPEVDPARVGVTGNSGGGTMTTWLCGVEPRWAVAAPGCFVTTFRRNMENELPADTEQCPPRVLALGLDHSDFLAAMAPKPVTILAKERDYFDARGAEEAFARLRELYGLLGAAENVGLFVGPTPHGYSQENREAMYRWFNRATGASDATTEPPLIMEKDETLWCTPKGQVAGLNSRTVFSFTREQSKSLAGKRSSLSGPELAAALTDLLKLPERTGVPEYRILRPRTDRNYPKKNAGNYRVETEPGVFAAVYRLSDVSLLSRPPRGPDRAILYVSHHSADAELRADPWLAEVVAADPQAAFYACDVRGVGESRPNTAGGPEQFNRPYGNDYFYAIHGLMLDRPYPGQKTLDLLRVLDWLASVGHKEVHLAAKGWGTIPATFSAVLAPIVTQVTLKNALKSYQEVAESEDYNWPLSSFVPGVLARFDLPDCYRELEGKKLQRIDPMGPVGRVR